MTLILKFLWMTLMLLGVLFIKPEDRPAFNGGKKLEKQEKVQGEFAHVVLFWLKNPDSTEDKAAFRKSLENFINQSKYVKTMHLGEPAGTNRDVIDRSYTYMMILTFSSREEQDAYQEEEVHKQFVRESENLWSKVTVYDSNNLW